MKKCTILFTFIFTLVCFNFKIFKIPMITNASNHPGLRFRYVGKTWDHEPKFVMEPGKFGEPVVKWGPMRVRTIYVKNPQWDKKKREAAAQMTDSDWRYIETVFGETLKIAQQFIREVRQMETPIVVPRRCRNRDGSLREETTECLKSEDQTCTEKGLCYDLDVPEEYSEKCTINNDVAKLAGKGANETDLLLFLSVEKLRELANAIPCQEDSVMRPVAGRIIIDVGRIKNRHPVYQMKHILMHELCHILFNPLAGVYYKDPETNGTEPYVAGSTAKFERRKWASAYGVFDREAVLLTLPSVKEYVQKHFNCPHLMGAELQNDSSVFHSNLWDYPHFDNMMFPDTLLSPRYTHGNQLSKLEVMVAIDSGWYHVNESAGRELTVTKGRGCDFAMSSCFEYMQKGNYQPEAISPYCERSKKYKWMCSLDHSQMIQCEGNDESNDVAPMFRLNNGLYYGGSFLHHCPIVTSDKDMTNKESTPWCREEDNAEFGELGATSGRPDSMCMKVLHLRSKKSTSKCVEAQRSYFGICVPRNCTNEGFRFFFGGQYFECPKNEEGKQIYADFTTDPNGCKVSVTFCCPSYDVCSSDLHANSSLLKLGECGCHDMFENFMLVSICSLITGLFFRVLY